MNAKLCQAQENQGRSEYSSLKVGDTISVASSPSDEAHVLIFVNSNACFTCELALDRFSKWKRLYPVEITLYLEGASQAFADEQKKQLGWAFTTIGDPLHIYAKAYGIKTPPFFYITAPNGVIRGMDKLAGIGLDVDSIEHMICCKPEVHNPKYSLLSSELRFTVHDSTGPVFIGKKHYVLSFTHSRKTAILDAIFRKILVIDSDGKVLRIVELNKPTRRFPVSTPVGLAWYIPDSIWMFRDFDARTLSCILLLYQVDHDSLYRVAYDLASFPSNRRILSLFPNPEGGWAGGITPKTSPDTLMEADRMIANFDSKGKLQSKFGPPNHTLTEFPHELPEEPFIAFDSDKVLYEWETPSEQINLYLHDTLIGHRALNFGKPYMPYRPDTTEPAGSTSFWLHLNATTSEGTGLFVGKHGEWVSAVYVNAEYPPGDHDPASASMIRHFCVHRENRNEQSLDREDLQLPPDFKPYSVEREYIYGSYWKDGYLDLETLRISK